MTSQSLACLLLAGEASDRTRLWGQLLERHLVRGDATSEGVVLVLAADADVVAAVRDLAALEAKCCAWMRVQVAEAPPVVRVSISSAEPGGPEVIRLLFGMALHS